MVGSQAAHVTLRVIDDDQSEPDGYLFRDWDGKTYSKGVRFAAHPCSFVQIFG